MKISLEKEKPALIVHRLSEEVGRELLAKLNLRVEIQRPSGEIPRTGYDIHASVDNVKVVGFEKGKKVEVRVWMDDKMLKAEGAVPTIAEGIANEIISHLLSNHP